MLLARLEFHQRVTTTKKAAPQANRHLVWQTRVTLTRLFFFVNVHLKSSEFVNIGLFAYSLRSYRFVVRFLG